MGGLGCGWVFREPTTAIPAEDLALSTPGAEAKTEVPAKTVLKAEAKAEARQTTIVTTEKASEVSTSATGTISAASPPASPASPALPAQSLLRLLWWAYLAGVAIFGLHFLIQFGYLIVKLLRHPGFDAGSFHLVELEEDAAPYSFWNRVFLNPNRYDPDTYHQIVQHEAVHVRQRHSLDLMLAELVVVVQWFNPFAWLYRRAIENNLEFLTDAEVLRQGEDPVGYQMSLVKVAAPNYPLGLTTSYNQNLLEKRIAMMKTKKSSLASGWKYLTIVPLLLLSVIQFNAVAQVPVAPAPTAAPVPVAAVAQSSVPVPPATPAPAPVPSVAPAAAPVPNVVPQPNLNMEGMSSPVPMPMTPNVNMVMPDVVEIALEAMEAQMNMNDVDFSKARRSWTAEIEGDEVCFTFTVTQDNRQHLSTNSRCFPHADLGTLPTGEMGEFKLTRASGTITFNGVFNGTEGLGSFNFAFIKKHKRDGDDIDDLIDYKIRRGPRD